MASHWHKPNEGSLKLVLHSAAPVDTHLSLCFVKRALVLAPAVFHLHFWYIACSDSHNKSIRDSICDKFHHMKW